MNISTKYESGQKVFYFIAEGAPGEIELVQSSISQIQIKVYSDNSVGITYVVDSKDMKEEFLFGSRRDAYGYVKSIISKNFRIKLTDDVDDELPEPEKECNDDDDCYLVTDGGGEIRWIDPYEDSRIVRSADGYDYIESRDRRVWRNNL